MALTFESLTEPNSVDGQNVVTQVSPQDSKSLITVTKVTFDSSYPTGGEAIVAANLGLTTLREVLAVQTIAPVVADFTVRWDRANSKLFISEEDGTSGINAQAGSASDMSAIIALITAIGE
ncbi:MAG: hypothetical protein J3T61_09010 [Candidatus Brocadiales bacterium]|nr:hypothetical protein [Candidatus Bathyanammoxibius sp.]